MSEFYEKWNPSPAVYAAYKKREVELARHNIKHSIGSTNVEKIRASTLHSTDTIIAALGEDCYGSC